MAERGSPADQHPAAAAGLSFRRAAADDRGRQQRDVLGGAARGQRCVRPVAARSGARHRRQHPDRRDGRARRPAAEGARGARLRSAGHGDLPGALGPRPRSSTGTRSCLRPRRWRPEQHLFFDGDYRGARLRLAAYRAANGYSVQVGETLNKRDRLVREILLAELVPTLLIAAATIGLAWWGVARGLRPLAHVRNELLGRSPRDLRPIPETASPIEISPVVEAFNSLLQQLRESSTMQQRFLANAAHQLRTPLAGLQMHLELMLRAGPSPDDARPSSRACTAPRSAPGASRRSSSPSPRRKARRITASRWRSWTWWRWRATRHATGRRRRSSARSISALRLRRRGPGVIRCSLPELLDNLIDNALALHARRRRRHRRHRHSRRHVATSSVEDTGPGIAGEEREKVFERFYRVAGTEGDGSGLGLAIVKEIVDRHGGVVAISTREGRAGTCVRVTFPPPATGR